MNGYGGSSGRYGRDSDDGDNPRMPFYRGAYEAQMARSQQGNGDASFGGPRYVPPHLRGDELDIIRPESSMSNITNNTFATQAPMGNYSLGPAQLTANMSAFNPFNTPNAASSSRTPQLRPFMGSADTRPGGQGTSRANMHSNISANDHTRVGFQGPRRPLGGVGDFTADPPPAIPPPIAQPMPLRRDSGAGTQTRAEYLAGRIKQGHADDPFDPDFGNPGPTRKAPPPPKPIPFPQHKSPSDNPLLPKVNGRRIEENNDGNCKAYVNVTKVAFPTWFAAATTTDQLPSLEQAFESLPFIEACRYAVPSTAGVVKVASIPYATTRAEVNAFLGKNVKICYQPAGTGFQSVHIIMDRHSGKTMDAFVEVLTQHEAIWIVNQFQKRLQEKRPPKIGGRVVEVALSSQDELMATMFPRAKQTTWQNGVPLVDPSKEEYYPGVFAEGFKGFFQDDEIYHMYQHSEKPQRSPFVTRCMIRHYEYLIASLYKFPWFAIEHVYLKERDMLFEAVHASLHAMIGLLRKTHHEKPDASKPSIATLSEYVTAIFVCPGFTDVQKSAIANTLEQTGFGKYTDDRALNLRFGGVSRFSRELPFKALVLKPGVHDEVVNYYATLLSDATIGTRALSLADIHAMNASQGSNSKKFGDLNIDYSGCRSIADAGRAELRYLEKVLGRILPRRAGTSAGSRSGSGSAGRISGVSSLRLSS